MRETTRFQHMALLGQMGRMAGLTAFKCRQKLEQAIYYANKLTLWRRVFPAEKVFVWGTIALILMTMDLIFMWPVYRQISQLLVGYADLLALPIGLGVNAFAVIISEKLSKCRDHGPFIEWELLRNEEEDRTAAHTLWAFAGRNRKLHVAVHFAAYLTVLGSLLWIRSILLESSVAPLVQVEFQLNMLGVVLAIVAVSLGMYISPLFQYLYWLLRLELLNYQIHQLIKKVSGMDSNIHLVYSQQRGIVEPSHDTKEALIRFLFRSKNMDYCNKINEGELEAYGAIMQNRGHSLSERNSGTA